MLDPFNLWNVQQVPEGFFIEDLAIRREHWSQFKGQHVRISAACRLVDRRFLSCRFPEKLARLKQNRNSAMGNDDVHLLSVEFDDVAPLAFNICATHKWYI